MTVLRVTQKGTKRSLRARNHALVLQSVAAGGGVVGRTDIVKETGLPAATVSAIVADLVASKLVRELGHADSRGGKPRVLLGIADDHYRFVGVHVGRDRVRASRLTLAGQVEETITLPHMAGEDTVPAVAGVVHRLVVDSPGTVMAVGVAAPGIIDDQGVIRTAVNYGWEMVPFGPDLSQACGLPVHMINDSNAVALSEAALSKEPESSVVLLWIGTGLSAGIVLDGRLYEGPEFRAGEIGHVDVATGLACRCGRRGCLETVASMPAILGSDEDDVVGRLLDGEDDSQVAALTERLHKAARELCRLVSMLTATLDITEFVVAGPVATHPIGPRLLRLLTEAAEANAMPGFPAAQVRFASLGEHSVVAGAVAHAIRQELGVMLTLVDFLPTAVQ